jgi:Fic family protein
MGRPRRAGEPVPDPFPAHVAASEGAGRAAQGAGLSVASADFPLAPPAEEVAARLDQLARLLVARAEGSGRGPGRAAAPALVAAAVVHGELLALRPFTSHNGLVARAAQRIVLISEGLDPKAICAAEVGLAELGSDAYRAALAGYVSATPEGLAAWIIHCGRALELGVRESTAVCEAMQRGMV